MGQSEQRESPARQRRQNRREDPRRPHAPPLRRTLRPRPDRGAVVCTQRANQCQDQKRPYRATHGRSRRSRGSRAYTTLPLAQASRSDNV